MILQFLEFYKTIKNAKEVFEEHQLNSDFYIDIYRSQPAQPELYEYFSLPAIFIDYTSRGTGKNQPRTISMTLHIITDDLPDASNISESNETGLSRFTYLLLLQYILEGCRLGKTNQLKFISENIIDTPVVNYHTQTYEFGAYIADMIPEFPEQIYGKFEELSIFGSLLNRPKER